MDVRTQIRIDIALHPTEAQDISDVLYEVLAKATGEVPLFGLSERQQRNVVQLADVLRSRVHEVEHVRSV